MARSLLTPLVCLTAIATAFAQEPVPPNLCTAAKITASSFEGERFHPRHAIDGMPILVDGGTENAWCSAMDQPSPGQWIAVELAEVCELSEVQVWYRVIAGEHRFVPASVTIQTAIDGAEWTTAVERSTDVPALNAGPDTAPRRYALNRDARHVRLLFEDGAQAGDVYDVIELVEIIIPAPIGWTPPAFAGGESVTRHGSRRLPALFPGEAGAKVHESDSELRIRLGDAEPVVIDKPLGPVGSQPPTVLPEFAPGHFEAMLESGEDVWGLEALAKPGDPSFEAVAGFAHPYKYPCAYIGAREQDPEPCVTWDGSVAANETGDYMAFGLNGERVPKRNAYDIHRGLLDGCLPAVQHVYLDRELGVGWEELVVCEERDQRIITYLRLRVHNIGGETQRVAFSVFPFVPYATSVPKPLARGSVRFEDGVAYVGSGLARAGWWMSDVGRAENDHLAYDLELEPGDAWQLAIKLNGDHARGGPAEPFVADVVPRSLFAALADEKTDWDAFLASGMTLETPDEALNDIIRATAAHTFVNVDGDVVKGGAFNAYDIHYPLLTMRIARFCLDWGYTDAARRYLEFLIDEPRNATDGGPKSLFTERGTSPVYDGGYFLQVLARYYQYTGDASFIRDNLETIDECLDYIRRKRQASMASEPEGSPKRGLISGRTTGDLTHATYAYCNDAPSWRGMVEIAKALASVGLTEAAGQVSAEAEAYRADILRSIEQVADHSTDPPFVPIVVDTPEPYESLHQDDVVSYANFRMYNHLLDAGILDEETTRWILDYRKTHGGEILGMIRWGDQVDNFLCEDVQWEKLRLERIDEFLLNFYAYISYALVPGVWTGYEEFSLDPMEGEDPPGRSNLKHAWRPKWETRMNHGYEQTRVSANIPELARFMVVQAERDEELLWLGRAVPSRWLEPGQRLSVRNAPTRWGHVSYEVRSGERRIDVALDLSGDEWPAINLRLRRGPISRVTLNGRPYSAFEGQTIALPLGLSGRNSLRAWLD